MMPVPMIVNPIPLKPKGGFSVEELVGRNTEEFSPKFQNLSSPTNLLKADSYFGGYPVVPRTEIQNSFEHYTHSVYPPLTTQDYVNLEYLELLRSRMPVSSSILGTDVHPWLFNRHPRFFPHRIQGPESFLFNPFRKPKRVRTAFSPSQLLQLEHAFEKNHYVVGNERKQLAEALHLTETQVKVWFQNRRTKHKRQKQDDDQSCESRSKDFCDTQEHSLSSEDETSALQEIGSPLNDKECSLWNSSHTKEISTTSVSVFPSTPFNS